MAFEFRKVGVLGAGVMGQGIAAHLANAGIPVLLLDIVPKLTPEDEAAGIAPSDPRFRNRYALAGLDGIKKSRPALLYTPRFLPLIEAGNFDDDWQRLAECDWIIEVVVERLDIKRQVFERLDAVRRPDSVISSNTSGLSLEAMIAGRSPDFRRNFLITHFFNPVRYMRLLEVVAGADTDPAVVEKIIQFGQFLLGKGIVAGKDTPDFVANRIGVFGIMATIHALIDLDYDIDEVDAITGPALARPKSASFGTSDLAGLDTLAHVVRTVAENCPDDEALATFTIPPFMATMIERRQLGRKTKAGFFKREKDAKGGNIDLVLDWRTGEYRPKRKLDAPSLKAAKATHDPGARIRTVATASDRAGAFAWRTLRDGLAYSSRRLGEISDTIVDIDAAMRWGYNGELGPFETWDALGVAETVDRMRAEGVSPASWVDAMLALGAETFYRDGAAGREFWDVQHSAYRAIERPASFILLSDLAKRSAPVFTNPGASLIDLGDGIACLQFHSKAQPKLNPIDDDIMAAVLASIDIAEKDFAGLVVHHQGEQFCAGANLLMLLEAAQNQQWIAIDAMVRKFQAMTMGLRFCHVPVVTAPFGFTFGGGAEIAMSGDRVCASAETYMGLIEVGVGLLPAGGGHVFMLERALAGIDEPVLSNLPFLRKAFEAIAMAKVSTSAEEARDLGYLRPIDHIEVNRDRQLWTAKRMALALAEIGYRPPQPRRFALPGREGLATIAMLLHNLKICHQISSHDEKIATWVGTILTGGDTTINNLTSEATILDLEREGFLSLCGEPKSQDRIKFMLLNNKPLRN